jgi:hypothetical protein
VNGIGGQIEKDILKVINSSSRPVSSREISLKINRAWHSVNTHCLRLQIAGKITGYKIGNMNIWSEIK